MNEFEIIVNERTGTSLQAGEAETLQVNVGALCNQACTHCHLDASPSRVETMGWPVMERVVGLAQELSCRLVDITGGAPELNPQLPRFIEALGSTGITIQVRTNLSVLAEPGMEQLPALYRRHGVHLVASMPCYLEENVTAQRGPGCYEKSVAAIRTLNDLGYGADPKLPLDLVYNPSGASLPPAQISLEADYKRELRERFGVQFTRLLVITNMPIGRFKSGLVASGGYDTYLSLLEASFNPATVADVMCRHQVSVGWDGTLYDCDFNLALGLSVDQGAPNHIMVKKLTTLAGRRIVTGTHCFGCTAGSGSSCSGALIANENMVDQAGVG